MSEYQYYEFCSVDRPLTDKEMRELRAVSSRAHISPTSFSNEYNWGNFKGDPEKWMELYFDAFVHVTNWGTRWFMLRVPKRLVPEEVLASYRVDEFFTFWSTKDHHILSFSIQDEESYEWEEGEGWLDSLLPVRSALLNGDCRCLYLSWLLTLQRGYLEDDDREPPVPVGLGELSPALEAFASFLRIDDDLIATAAEGYTMAAPVGPSHHDYITWTAQLPPSEKDTIIVRLLKGDDPHLSTELRQRVVVDLQKKAGSENDTRCKEPRTAKALQERLEIVAKQRRREEAARKAREREEQQKKEAAERAAYLDSIAGTENRLWSRVHDCIAAKSANQYDQAVKILTDLRDLAIGSGESTTFFFKMNGLMRDHAKKRRLIERFEKARLLG